MNVRKGIQIIGVSLGLLATSLISACSNRKSNNNPVNNTGSYVLNNIQYPDTTDQLAVKGKIADHEGERPESIEAKVDGEEPQESPINWADSSFNINIPKGNGPKIVRTSAFGPNGYSNEVIDTVILRQQNQKPVAGSFILPVYAIKDSIDARVSATGADSMKIAEFLASSGFIPYDTLVSLILSAGDGQKTFYAVFKNKAGDLSDTISAKIYKDMAPPVIPATFSDTIKVNDNRADFGNLAEAGLLNEYFKAIKDGAVVDSGSLVNLNDRTYDVGTTYIVVFKEDSAGNKVQDTAVVVVEPLEKSNVKQLTRDSLYSWGGSLVDSSRQKFSLIDSLGPADYKNYKVDFHDIFKFNDTLYYVVRYADTTDTAIERACRFTSDMNDRAGWEHRFLSLIPGLIKETGEKLKSFDNRYRK